MPTDGLALIGAGGHARVVLDALLAGGGDAATIVVTAAAAPTRPDHLFGGIPVQAPEFAPVIAGRAVHVAIGDNATRIRLIAEAQELGLSLAKIIHPRAVVSERARLGEGSFVAALAIVGPEAEIGTGTIINHAGVVDHDCRVGAGVHIAPGAVLGGGVSVGDRAFVGANATVLPGRSIGEGATVGAGAVVTENVPPDSTVVGAPARSKSSAKES